MMNKVKTIIYLLILIVIVSGVIFFVHKNAHYSKSDRSIAKEDVQKDKKSEEVEKPIKELPSLSSSLDAYITKHTLDDKVFIFVSGLTSKDSYMRNIDTKVFAASIYKLPLAMLYYEKINAGEYTLSDTLMYEKYHYESGGPIGDNFAVGTRFRLETLLKNIIVYSDNTAAHILYENFGGGGGLHIKN